MMANSKSSFRTPRDSLTCSRKTLLSYTIFSNFHNFLAISKGYVDFGRFDKLNYFVTGSGIVDFVQTVITASPLSLSLAYCAFTLLVYKQKEVRHF
ncbi:hypothetical protein ACB092_10G023400 [Castanea dentata]